MIPSAGGPSVSNSLGWNSTSSSVPIPIATSPRIPAIDPSVRPPALHHSSAKPLSLVSNVFSVELVKIGEVSEDPITLPPGPAFPVRFGREVCGERIAA